MRMKTREIQIGSVTIGGDHPIAIQSMTNTKTETSSLQDCGSDGAPDP